MAGTTVHKPSSGDAATSGVDGDRDFVGFVLRGRVFLVCARLGVLLRTACGDFCCTTMDSMLIFRCPDLNQRWVNNVQQKNECYIRNVCKKRCTRASSAACTLTEVTALFMHHTFHVGARPTSQKSCSLRTSRRTGSVREAHLATTRTCLALTFFTCFATATTANPSSVTNPGAIGPHDLWHLHVTQTSIN